MSETSHATRRRGLAFRIKYCFSPDVVNGRLCRFAVSVRAAAGLGRHCILDRTGIERGSMKFGYLTVGILFASSVASVGVRAEDNFINWRTDYRAALQEAKQTQKPVFLEFRCEA
jgi:hypothetical protein